MLPRAVRPARSSSLGSMPKTEGGNPRVVGGSPAARPISRCASASRVSESITSSTSFPWSRKYSATAVAVKAARTRASAGSSLVATTTTLLARSCAQVALDKLVDFAAALADQRHDVHVGRRVARHHAQRDALADARAGEDSDPLSFAAGQHAVDRPNAGRQRRVDARPLHGRQRRAIQRHAMLAAPAAGGRRWPGPRH